MEGRAVCHSLCPCPSLLWVTVAHRGLSVGHCGAVSFQKHCDRQKANLRIRFKPSLFQHVGTHSSLAGKIQKLKVGTSCPSCRWPGLQAPRNWLPLGGDISDSSWWQLDFCAVVVFYSELL